MENEINLCSHFSKINESKFSNSLNNFEKAKCKFKHASGVKSDLWQSLWICLKCYKIGCGRSSDGKCMLKHYDQDPKHCVVVRPFDEMIW